MHKLVQHVAGAAISFALSAVALSAVPVHAKAAEAPGALYALTNSPAGNAVLVFRRAGNGALAPAGSFATGGVGSGASLGSQGAVVVSEDHRFLFAVNAGSDSVSSFRIRPQGLELVDTEPSGGARPVSVAYRAGLLYALNAGEPNNVSGFRVSPQGEITPLDGSTRPLSAAATGPAQVGFSEDGATLIVTEKATSVVDTYSIDEEGYLDGPLVHASAGPVPFGFAVDRRNILLVSEAGAGGGASTYVVDEKSGISPVSTIVTGQQAACWTVVTRNGRYGYVSNGASGNLTGFALHDDGSATMLDQDGVTGTTGGNPTDMALSRDSRYLYVLVNALNRIAVFRVAADGSLEALPPRAGTPAGLAGLAGF